MPIDNPNMTFLYPLAFEKQWEKCGLTQSDRDEMESIISDYGKLSHHIGQPYVGNIIQKTGGAIELRFSPESSRKGKSGSYRVIYFIALENTYAFLDIYPKNVKDTLSDKEKKEIKQFITEFKKALQREEN